MKTLITLVALCLLTSCASVQRNMENTPSDRSALWYIMSSGVAMIGSGYSHAFWDNAVWSTGTGVIEEYERREDELLFSMFTTRLAAYMAGWLFFPEGQARDNWFNAWTAGNVVQTTVNMSGVLSD